MSLPVHLAPDLAGVAHGDEVVLTGDEAHHAVAVRRLTVHERLVLTDGQGTRVTATVLAVARRELRARVDHVEQVADGRPSVTVVQAIPKGDRGELSVEVLTEVGVARIVPWSAARCVVTWKGERRAKAEARWAGTAREAAKQARRSWHPEVTPLADTDEVVRLVRGADLAVVLHEEAVEPLAALTVPADGELLVVVGPEGGLTDGEVERFAGAGAVTCHLGTEVLRTSTAGVAAVAALLSRTSRWTGAPRG